jgi:hypothetical protein
MLKKGKKVKSYKNGLLLSSGERADTYSVGLHHNLLLYIFLIQLVSTSLSLTTMQLYNLSADCNVTH